MTQPSHTPMDISFSVPKSPENKFYSQITFLGACAIVHVTTRNIDEPATSLVPLGSFVYAMPDRLNTPNSLSTPLISSGPSIDYATRLAKILARRMQIPVYVGCSVSINGMTSEEEMEGFKTIVEQISRAWEQFK